MAKSRKRPAEIALIGDVDDWEEDAVKALLDVGQPRSPGMYPSGLSSPALATDGDRWRLRMTREL